MGVWRCAGRGILHVRFNAPDAAILPASVPSRVSYDLLLRELQDSVMSIRTQPVKSVFQRMPRLVRELAAQTNKEVRLLLEGESTEVDKTVIERLGDPLTHMIRNAVDHGVEMPEDRLAAGKPRVGRLRLSAEQDGDQILLIIQDDGKGMSAEVLRRKCVEKGLLEPEAAQRLSERECFELIFLPGFSTKSEISDISGRGVGMDVVKRNIEKLRGTVEITSELGQGSIFRIKLPLTMAIIDGLVVRVGTDRFILPSTSVQVALLREWHAARRADAQASTNATAVMRVGPVLALTINGIAAGLQSTG